MKTFVQTFSSISLKVSWRATTHPLNVTRCQHELNTAVTRGNGGIEEIV